MECYLPTMERVRNRIPPDTLFSNPDIDQVDYIVVSGNGSGKPATPQVIREKYNTPDFQPVYNHLN